MKRNLKVNTRVKISIFAVAVIFLITAYTNVAIKKINKREFENKMIEIYEKNQTPVFSVEKIYLYSSANVVDNSIDKNLQNLNIYQYADIAIYINNRHKQEELTLENTIKELYIDNIRLETDSKIGKRNLFYTSPLDFGKKSDLETYFNSDRIDFDIVYTNEENNKTDFSNPTFYTDCSNPISLKYLNKDIVNEYKLDKDKVISFDGNLLKEAKVPKEDIQCKIKFKINLVNNNDEKFSCWMNFNIPLDELYKDGKTIKSANTSGDSYNFFAL